MKGGGNTHTHSPTQWGDIKMRAFTPRTLAVVTTHQASRALFRRANFLWPHTAALWLSPCHKRNILYYTISPMDTVCIIMTKHKRRKAERFMSVQRHTHKREAGRKSGLYHTMPCWKPTKECMERCAAREEDKVPQEAAPDLRSSPVWLK